MIGKSTLRWSGAAALIAITAPRVAQAHAAILDDHVPLFALVPRVIASTPIPGGYWNVAERGTPEPPTGHDERQIGGWLAAVGTLRTLTAVGQIVAGSRYYCGPGHKLAIGRGECHSLQAYGWSGVVLGGGLLVSGLVYLSLGSIRGYRHRRWVQGRPIAAMLRDMANNRWRGRLTRH